MANEQHLAELRSGVKYWNRWRREYPKVVPDLRGADLRGEILNNANLRLADLREANLRSATLRSAKLFQSNLRGAELRDTDLSWAKASKANLILADLSKASLRGVDMVEADLRKANLSDANLSDADLSRANLSEANLSGVNLSNADLSEAYLQMANLCEARLINTSLLSATLDNCDIYGISAWNVALDGAKQANLRIRRQGEPSITVDNLEVAQFLYMLQHNEKLRAILDTIISKVVLILGRFSAERKPSLDALREALRDHPNGYIPVLFDFAPLTQKPVLDTVKTLANLARFVVVDLTDPNMVRSEVSYITDNVPTVPVRSLIERDAALPSEYESWLLRGSFIPVYRYANLKELLASLDETVIQSVERLVHPRRLDGPSPNTPEPT